MLLKRIIAPLFFLSSVASSQTAPSRDSTAPKQTPPVDFSGIMFANYQYRGEDAAQSANKFDVERAYLTFRASAGKRASIRITTDIYQQSSSPNDSYYRGWSLRAKYAHLQYEYVNARNFKASARLGLLQTVFIEHDESFWPRWISNSPTERAGFFSSADAGIANTVSFSSGRAEIYSTITNGPGYTSREIDRFKDFASRITIRPWATHSSPMLKSIALSAWGYKGSTASSFVAGGPAQLGSVGDGLRRDRYGAHAGTSTPRLTAAVQYARRVDESEQGLNTSGSPRAVTQINGTLASAYSIVRPLAGRNQAEPHPLSLVARLDRIVTDTKTDQAYEFFIIGGIWDLSNKVSVSFDHQQTNPVDGRPISPARTWFLHFVARF